jgi:hypothetical protein
VYPTTASQSAPRTTVRANPSTLNLEDLRFYHQFLTVGFPALPLRGDKVWAQCAAMSYKVSYLYAIALIFHFVPRKSNPGFSSMSALRMLSSDWVRRM